MWSRIDFMLYEESMNATYNPCFQTLQWVYGIKFKYRPGYMRDIMKGMRNVDLLVCYSDASYAELQQMVRPKKARRFYKDRHEVFVLNNEYKYIESIK